MLVAGQVRDGIAALALAHPIGEGRKVTVSIGAACARPAPGDDRLALLERSDAALYRAKQAGRDRIAA